MGGTLCVAFLPDPVGRLGKTPQLMQSQVGDRQTSALLCELLGWSAPS